MILTEPTPEQARAARETAGLTQAQMAELAGYANRSAWAAVETGAKGCDAARWTLVCLRLGVHPTHRLTARPAAGKPR